MSKWIEGGVQLGWLIDPDKRVVYVYSPGQEPESIVQADRLKGQGPVRGFVLELESIWSAYNAELPPLGRTVRRKVALPSDLRSSRLLCDRDRHLIMIMLRG